MKKALVPAFAAAAMCLMSSAQAQTPSPLYLSLDAGRSDFRIDDADFKPLATLSQPWTPENTDKKAQAYAVHAGYRLFPNLALELGYTDLGTANFEGMHGERCVSVGGFPCLSVIENLTGTLSASSWDIAAKGTVPLAEKWSAYGKVGVSRLRIKTQTNSLFTNPANHTSTSPKLALGLAYQITPVTSVHLEWNRHFKGSGDAADGNIAVDATSLGVSFNF